MDRSFWLGTCFSIAYCVLRKIGTYYNVLIVLKRTARLTYMIISEW